MGGLIELNSPQELQDFLQTHPVCLVTFSAHWCGPCRASKPQLEEMAKDSKIPFGYVYESDIGDFLHTFQIRAFPTYVCFQNSKEVQRVEGVNFGEIEKMVSSYSPPAIPETGGTALGGGGGQGAISAEEARKLRLAKLGVAATASASPPASAPPAEAQATSPAPEPAKPAASEDTSATMITNQDEENKETSNDVEMTDANPSNPVENLDPESLKTLTESMGFTLIRAQKGLLFSAGTVESAVEWLMEHQDDADIDDPIPEGFSAKAQSYKCNECGKILSNMANLELHANKTGHSDFEESTQSVKPLTAEEKAAKIAEIKELLKLKRAEREESEKADELEKEKQRRFMGKEMAKTREQMEMEQRKRDAMLRRKEKEEAKKERARIRAELEKDKMERLANKGKLHSKLGVEGYNPDAIQYDEDVGTEEPATQKPKTVQPDSSKIDEYIKKVSSYRAGGDGEKCLKVLKAYVGNAADNPDEEKFKTINMENKAFKSKVKPFIGAKHLLLAVGFAPKEGEPTLLVLGDDADREVLKDTKEKLEKAIAAF